jgi:hypothetical protein
MFTESLPYSNGVQRNDNMGDPEADGRLIRERLLNKQGVK